MPPPSLLSSTIVSSSPSRRAASSPPMSWASATSPISSTTGPAAAAAAPKALDTVPSMPLAPRLHSTRGGSARTGQKVSMSRTGIEEATNSVASSGSSTPSSAATAGSDSRWRRARRGSPRPRARRRCASAKPVGVTRRRPRPEPPASERPARRGCSSRRAKRSASPPGPSERLGHHAAGSCQAPSGSMRDLARRQIGEPGAQRLRDGQIADPQNQVGAMRAANSGSSRRSAS